MKRCPECRRDYYDDSLIYCLDDGTALLEGPSSGDHPTVILPSGDSERTKVFGGEPSADLRAQPAGRNKFGITFIIACILVVAVAGAGFAIYRYTRQQPVVTFQAANFARMTSTGNASAVAISPDGKYIAHIQDEGGRQSLWIKQVATTSNLQLLPPASIAYRGLAFSRDGSYLYYSVDETGDQKGTLYKIPAIGGDSRKILSGIANSVTFSPDGKRMAFFRTTSVEGGREDALIISNSDGTDEKTVAARRGDERFHRGNFSSPAWSPDGKTIACPIGNLAENQMSVAAVSVDTGEVKTITKQKWFIVRQVAWVDDDRILLTANTLAAANYQVWQISLTQGDANRVTNDLTQYRFLSLSPASGALAVTQGTGSANLAVMPINNLAQVTQVTQGEVFNTSVSWLPDGRLAYTSEASGKPDIFIKDTRGGSAKQVTSEAGANHYVTVSPDGRYLVFMSDRTGKPNIWRADLDGGNAKQLTDGFDLYPDVSPDGRWIFYQSWVDGRNVLKKVSIDGGQPVQLTDYPAGRPALSPDGKHIAITYTESRTSPILLAVISSDGGPPLKTFPLGGVEGVESLGRIQWTSNGEEIVHARAVDGVANLWAQPVAGGDAKRITNFDSQRIFWFDFSSDGKQLVVSRGQLRGDVVLISGIK